MSKETILYVNGEIRRLHPQIDISDPHIILTDDSTCYLDFNQSVNIHGTRLPHWDQDETCAFITFRLRDSLPKEVREELANQKNQWLRAHPHPWDSTTKREYRRKFSEKIERWLDNGYGSCILRDFQAAKIVAEVLSYGGSYDVMAFVVMPNHVHALLYPLGDEKIEEIVQPWKSVSSHRLRKLYGRSWCGWMDKYYDRLIRNSKHFRNCVNYINKNYMRGGILMGGSVYSPYVEES